MEAKLRCLVEFVDLMRPVWDSLMIDFFTQDKTLWERLPTSWQSALDEIPMGDLFAILAYMAEKIDSVPLSRVYPLSFLCFLECAKTLPLSRFPEAKQNLPLQVDCVLTNGVKRKKQHEIQHLALSISNLIEMNKLVSCTGERQKTVIDVGAGLGFLSRQLAFHHGITVIAVEAQTCNTSNSIKRDHFVENQLEKRKKSKFEQNTGCICTKHCEPLPSIHDDSKESKDEISQLGKIYHVNTWIDSCGAEQLINMVFSKIDNPTGNSSLDHVSLVGLHACGNLSATILRCYAIEANVDMLVSVGCCYMKLTEPGCSNSCKPLLDGPLSHEEQTKQFPCSENLDLYHFVETRDIENCGQCFPMSQFLSRNKCPRLGYVGRELACHALDAYISRVFKQANFSCPNPHQVESDESKQEHNADFSFARVHCYRAVFEACLIRVHPELRRLPIGSVKRADQMDFSEYASRALDNLDGYIKKVQTNETTTPSGAFPSSKREVLLSSIDRHSVMSIANSEFAVDLLQQWNRVFVFFILRTLLGPSLESLILLDRAQYLLEKSCVKWIALVPLFDSLVSPRNIVLYAGKFSLPNGIQSFLPKNPSFFWQFEDP